MTLSAEGFSTEAQYTASPRVEVPGKTTRGFIPGPIKPGEWAVELGVGAVIAQSEGDADGKVKWRVEIELSEDPAFKDEPYQPAALRHHVPPAPRAGWYAGDMHVHAEHSNYGAATMTDTFDYAFKPLAEGGAGLDFITLSDYVSGYPAWNEIGRYQSLHPEQPGGAQRRGDHLPRAHQQPRAAPSFVDYRTTPVYERLAGRLAQAPERAGATPGTSSARSTAPAAGPRSTTRRSSRRPTPPRPPPAAAASGSTRTRETDYSQVDALEIATGPVELRRQPQPVHRRRPSPSTSGCSASGHRIAAVGSSDSHKAGAHERRARGADRAGHHGRAAPASCPRTASAAACRRATPT